MSKRKLKRITVKIGTRVLTKSNNEIDRKVIREIAGQVSTLLEKGIEVIIVSSGAIGAGLGLLKLDKKHKSLSELQAIASVGQNHLMDIYNEFLGKKGYIAGQILLTQEDFDDRRRFLNIRYTLNTLLKYKAVPVINENDSISTDEIKWGDNDHLSYLVADLASSDLLLVLTDVDGLYDDKGQVIGHVDRISDDIRAFCRGKGCDVSSGGMLTKLEAAKNTTKAGIPCVIAKGRKKDIILDVAGGKGCGTFFEASTARIRARKRWIAYSMKPKGSVIVDEGAAKAIVSGKKSLLPSGIARVMGKFSDGDVVDVETEAREVIARGLSNYTSEEISRIKGLKSDRIEKELGYKDYDEVIHRDNLVMIEE